MQQTTLPGVEEQSQHLTYINASLISSLMETEEGAAQILRAASKLIEKKTTVFRRACTSPDVVRDVLRIKLRELEHEEFWLIHLDNQNKLLDLTRLFRGTIDQSAVYPREVVKEVLKRNSASIIIAHNHPSGESTPSSADIAITQRIKECLGLINIKLLDHLIVGDEIYSFAENSLL
ncbi:JAB domain-containing protein [Thalassolituus marinus]|uniref:DNA repair protein RadC n=1 Tax=Thalassolituus marinus TaxID=671053 RepID=A0ABS7ZV59_9GAMM|nr:DNA repair protein RadC [Thalassolituus marinus]MCA6065472.1 DNA repair protein RadC [Thalassolituus marinus]